MKNGVNNPEVKSQEFNRDDTPLYPVIKYHFMKKI